MRTSTTALALIAVLGVAALTGCTAAPADSGAADAGSSHAPTSDAAPQSVAEACATVYDEIQLLEDEAGAAEIGQGDFEAVIAVFETFGAKLGDLQGTVGNDEVRQALVQMDGAVTDAIGVFTSADGSMEKLATLESEFQEASDAMTAATEKLDALCG